MKFSRMAIVFFLAFNASSAANAQQSQQYGDYCSGRIWALTYDGVKPAINTLLLTGNINISSFGIDKDNEIYICDLNGKIYKFATNAPAPTTTPDPLLTPTPIPTTTTMPSPPPVPIKKGKIFGLVVNVIGNPVESAKVKLKGKVKKISKKTLSDGTGFFEFTDLDADTYKITTKKKEYKKNNHTITPGDGEAEEITIEIEKIVEI